MHDRIHGLAEPEQTTCIPGAFMSHQGAKMISIGKSWPSIWLQLVLSYSKVLRESKSRYTTNHCMTPCTGNTSIYRGHVPLIVSGPQNTTSTVSLVDVATPACSAAGMESAADSAGADGGKAWMLREAAWRPRSRRWGFPMLELMSSLT